MLTRASISPSFVAGMAFVPLLATGCAKAGVPVAHPVNAGVLEATTASGLTVNEANMIDPIKKRGVVKVHFPEVPGLDENFEKAVTDTAILIRLDGAEACFDVTLGTPIAMENPFVGERFKLIFDGGEAKGKIRAKRDRIVKTVDRVGEFWDARGSKYEIVGERVVILGGVVCFEHGGELEADTSNLRLYVTSELDHLNHESFRFALTANPEVEQWPKGKDGKPQPFVARGYENAFEGGAETRGKGPPSPPGAR